MDWVGYTRWRANGFPSWRLQTLGLSEGNGLGSTMAIHQRVGFLNADLSFEIHKRFSLIVLFSICYIPNPWPSSCSRLFTNFLMLVTTCHWYLYIFLILIFAHSSQKQRKGKEWGGNFISLLPLLVSACELWEESITNKVYKVFPHILMYRSSIWFCLKKAPKLLMLMSHFFFVLSSMLLLLNSPEILSDCPCHAAHVSNKPHHIIGVLDGSYYPEDRPDRLHHTTGTLYGTYVICLCFKSLFFFWRGFRQFHRIMPSCNAIPFFLSCYAK